MALRLSKIIFLLLVFITDISFAQEDPTERSNEKEYKDGEQFEKFYKRRRIIGSWQINQLKEGALVVKLKTNSLLVNAFEKSGDQDLADQARIEAAGISVNMMRAFLNNYKFSKVYFIYSNMADSLLKGTRENIFLDTNLVVNPAIKMTEKFYLLAESDRLYNSSIGFVKEDSARFEVERGSPSTEEPFIVIKNKFGHQLKKPFPYSSKIKMGLDKTPEISYIPVYGTLIPFNVVALYKKKDGMSFNYNNRRLKVYIPKSYLYDRLSYTVQMLNDNFFGFYQYSPPPVRIDPVIQPFLY